MAAIDNESRIENAFKVKLQSTVGETVVFDVTPDLIETRNVNYSAIEPVHMPGQINVYKNTSSRSFNISNARIISRTQQEADRNLKRLWLLRSWCVPRFGQSTLTDKQANIREGRALFPNALNNDDTNVWDSLDRKIYGVELLGAPPAVLYLSAYSRNSGLGQTQHINRVPAVIQQLSIPYPSDVDYIPTTTGVPMPTIMTIDMTLIETHSPGEYERFSLDSYKMGNLRNF